MGCSPSKGTNLGHFGAIRKGRMLPPVPQESKLDDNGGNNITGSAKGETKGNKESPHVQVTPKEAQLTSQKKRHAIQEVTMEEMSIDKVESTSTEEVPLTLRKEKNDKQEFADKKPNRKQKKAVKGTKGKRKDKDKIFTDQKVDFPEPLVKAHQAAYAFLNPSISKYDSILGLMEEATQTQVSVQTMVSFMALRYEEIIQGMEEIAEEGERVLTENGEHLAWPSQIKNVSSSSPPKSGPISSESPPDLLQQLLQYTTQRMRNVSQTVCGIGDSALEEAVDYFASVSELLQEKLKIKHTLEARLMRLLTRIEMASLRKPGAEDSALFSEDSGIGAENESLNGSEKHRRESCGSTGTNRTPSSPTEYTAMNITGASREKYGTQISPSFSLTSLNSLDSTCTIIPNDQRYSLLGSVSLDDGEDDIDEEEEDKGVGDGSVAFRQQSNSSPKSSATPPLRKPTKRIENPQNVEMTLKMKNAISGRIKFIQKQNTSSKAKIAGTPKTSRQDWVDEELQSPKRPQTATAVRRPEIKKNPVSRGQRSRSAESLRSKGEDPTLFELERTQKTLNQRIQRMSKSKVGGNSKSVTSEQTRGNSPAQSPAINRKQPPQVKNSNSQPPKDKSSLSKCSNKKEKPLCDIAKDKPEEKTTPKCFVKDTPLPSPPLSPQPSSGFHRGRNSVKKLIDTFSQGIEVRESPTVLGPLKGVQRCGVPVLPGLGNVEAVLSMGVTSCRPVSTTLEKNYYLDLDSLPPPPMEVLMDTSFESTQSGSTAAGDGTTKVGKTPVLKRAAVSQRLRASIQTVTVLPSKGSLTPSSKIALQDTSTFSKVSQPDVQLHQGMETDFLNQQVRKISHTRKSSDSNLERSSMSCEETSESQGQLPNVQHNGKIPVPQPNTSATTIPSSSFASSQPLATPSASKGRMLPSTPTTPNSLHRRLPSPLISKKEATTPSTESPSVNMAPSTPPATQRRLSSPLVAKQNTSTFYSFKAPSPPASPKVQRWSRENSTEESSSARTFSNARSVFCPVSPSMFETKPCSVPQPPQAWTSNRVSVLSSCLGSRGRFPVSVQGPRPFVRRSQSDRRPSLSMTSRFHGTSVAESCGSEPSICSKG